MKKGFTLIELLAVISLIGLISIIALPSVISQLTKSKGNANGVANQTLIAAAEEYIDNNVNLQAYKTDTKICVTLEVLVDNGSLESPIKNLETGKNMDLKTNAIEVTYYANNKIIRDGKVGALSKLSCDQKIQ